MSDQDVVLPNTCWACPDCPYGGPRVGHRGNPEAPIVFIAEAPGAHELRKGRPLEGPSGNVFWSAFPNDETLLKWGLRKEDFYIINAMQCRPKRTDNQTENNQILTRGAHACRNRLLSQVQAFPRKLVVAMGNYALRSVTGNWNYKITQVRGGLVSSSLATIGILPALHPAALLRGTGNYRQFRRDIRYAIDLLRGQQPFSPVIPDFRVLDNAAKVLGLVWSWLKDPPEVIACDVETTGFNRQTDELLVLGLCGDPDLVFEVPGTLVPLLRRLFREYKGRFVWQNGKFDMSFVRRNGCPEASVDEDTMLLSYALDETGGIHDLGQLAGDWIGAPEYKHIMKPYEGKGKHYGMAPKPVLYRRNADDCSNTLQLYHILRDQVREDPRLERLYTRVLIPASELLWWVEHHGIYIHPNRLAHNKLRLEKEIEVALKAVQEAATPYGLPDIEPGSPLQVAELLFDKIGLRPPRMGERSTAKDVLDSLKHPVIRPLKDYRKAVKAKGTYADGLEKHRHETGRVHSTYLIHGTRTGRLSSRKPNMQNIPRDRKLRGMFAAPLGRVFVKVDLNQAELRSLACLSGDSVLTYIYTTPGVPSVHDTTAEECFPGLYRTCTDSFRKNEMKMIAKNVNFGIIYGIAGVGLSEQTHWPINRCNGWIASWAKKYEEAWDFINHCRRAPLEGLTLITPFGRKKRHWIVTRENLHGLMNEAANFPHQSIASDITLMAAAEARPLLAERGVWIVNLIHDEILAECDDNPETVEFTKRTLIRIMEATPLKWGIDQVPFKAEADVGRRWGIYRKGVKNVVRLDQYRGANSPEREAGATESVSSPPAS